MSGVTPQSTTASLAADVPKVSSRDMDGSSDLPGSFPETPAAEASEFSVNPIPATSGIGNPVKLQSGDKVPDPNTLTSNTVSSTVHDDPSLAKAGDDSQQTFGVAPLPATSGIGNPIQLKPGEKIPDTSTFTGNTINSAVTTDKESYENSTGAPQLPDVVTPQNERDARGGGMFNLPEMSKNMIPESSLPMGGGTVNEQDPGFTIQSAGPQATTAELASKVPIEPRGVPEVVQESQSQAGFDPEASGNPEAVEEKTAMEKELESKVPEEPSTSEGTSNEEGGTTDKKDVTGGEIAGMAAGGAGATATVAAAAGYASEGNPSEQLGSTPSRGLPASVQQSIDEMNKGTPIAATVPHVVQESIAESHQSPEAAASKEMVSEKGAMEAQLLKKVKTEEASGEPAPTASAALSESAPAPTSTPAAATSNSSSAPPAASATKSGSGLAAPAAAPAMTPAAQNAVKQSINSRDVSPMSHGPGTSSQGQPTITTGVGSSMAPAVSETPAAATVPKKTEVSKPTTPSMASPMSTKSGESSASASADKKSKRSSGFFGKLRQKFGHDKEKK